MTHTASSRSNRLLKMMCHTVLATRNVSEGILTAQQPSASSIDCPKDLRTTKGMPTDTKNIYVGTEIQQRLDAIQFISFTKLEVQ